MTGKLLVLSLVSPKPAGRCRPTEGGSRALDASADTSASHCECGESLLNAKTNRRARISRG
jgi:hypothetical protein